MPTRMVDCRRTRAVLVSVYVEKPRKRRPSSNGGSDRLHHHHHHHHYVHHSIRQEVTLRKTVGAGKGYNRRAELLLYSRRLRESSASSGLDVDVVAETSPLEPKPTPSINQQPSENIVAVQAKPKRTRTASSPACLRFLPRFITKSLTGRRAKKPKKKQQNGDTNTTMKAVMKSLQMSKKKRGFISKLYFLRQRKR